MLLYVTVSSCPDWDKMVMVFSQQMKIHRISKLSDVSPNLSSAAYSWYGKVIPVLMETQFMRCQKGKRRCISISPQPISPPITSQILGLGCLDRLDTTGELKMKELLDLRIAPWKSLTCFLGKCFMNIFIPIQTKLHNSLPWARLWTEKCVLCRLEWR